MTFLTPEGLFLEAPIQDINLYMHALQLRNTKAYLQAQFDPSENFSWLGSELDDQE